VIQPIVEGDGEVEALRVLLRRLIYEFGIYDLDVRRPIQRPRTALVSEEKFRRAIKLARSQSGVRAIIVVFDLDDDCARDVVPNLLRWCSLEAPPLPFGVALARREYEAWFLAAIGSLRGRRHIRDDATDPANPEAIRDAKGALSKLMPRAVRYVETADQAALSAQLDLGQAYLGASSFRKLVKELCRILIDLGYQPAIPVEWTSP
jgi:hypothetical protein